MQSRRPDLQSATGDTQHPCSAPLVLWCRSALYETMHERLALSNLLRLRHRLVQSRAVGRQYHVDDGDFASPAHIPCCAPRHLSGSTGRNSNIPNHPRCDEHFLAAKSSVRMERPAKVESVKKAWQSGLHGTLTYRVQYPCRCEWKLGMVPSQSEYTSSPFEGSAQQLVTEEDRHP